MVERERAYVLTPDSIPGLLRKLGATTQGVSLDITDHYLSPDLRLRIINHEAKVRYLTRKTGDKAEGQREEKTDQISRQIASVLTPDTQLTVKKVRDILSIDKKGRYFSVSLDVVSEPMKLAILEIESVDDSPPPTAKEIFGIDMKECPLGCWDLFKQKIGICGAPSAGKTETARMLSRILNIDFEANSFHVLEYATSFIQKYDRHPDSMDQFLLWHSQREREKDAANKANMVISDSPTFLAYVYMLFNNREKLTPQLRIHLAKLYKRVLEDLDSYSMFVYLPPSPIVSNRIRYQTSEEVEDIAERIFAFLQQHNTIFIVGNREKPEDILHRVFYMNHIS